MQNYYRLLGVSAAAPALEIEYAYLRQRARCQRLAATDRAMRARLADLEAGYAILVNPRRRVAYDLLLALDWALPARQYAHETVRSRFPVAVSASLSDPQLAYRVHTEHTTFRLPSAVAYRVRENQPVRVWQTPLLGVVQRVSAPASPDGPAPFRPYGGTIYGTFALLPLLLGAVAAVGAWPGRAPETVVNTASVSGLLAVLALVVLLWF